MSGSDGPSTPGTGFGSGGDDGQDCSKLQFDAPVLSPSTTLTISVGDAYDLDLNDSSSPIVELLSGGDIVGAIRPLPVLLRCLRSGVPFGATVTSASGGAITVHVEAK